MSEFKAITTQEEFDSAIKERIERERRTQAEKYADYEEIKSKLGTYEKQVGDLNAALDSANEIIANHSNELSERDSKIKAYETNSVKMRIANEMGLSYDATNFLTGDDEETIRQSAESLKKLVGTTNNVPPLATTEPENYGGENQTKTALKEMLKGLKEGE